MAWRGKVSHGAAAHGKGGRRAALLCKDVMQCYQATMIIDGDEPSFAEEMLNALMPELIRQKIIPEDLVLDLADRIGRRADGPVSIQEEERLNSIAHQLRCWGIEAAGPTQEEWQADRRRKRFRVVEGKEET